MPPKVKRQRMSERIQDIPDVAKRPLLKVNELCQTKPSVVDQERIASSITLQNILSPLDADVFLQKCFRECAVYIPSMSEDGDRFQWLREHLYDLDPRMLLRETSSDNIFVWLKQANGLIHSVEVADPESALSLLKSGHSTYCRAPPAVEQHLVSSLLAGTGYGCGQFDSSGQSTTCFGRGEVEVFLSSPGHETNWHYDFQENFTLQLSGVKRWSLQRGTIKHPLRGCTPHYAAPDTVEGQLKSAKLSDNSFRFGFPQIGVNAVGEVDQVVLRPGDVLYFPAGMWHKVEVIEAGVSMNVSLMASSYAEVTSHAIKHLLLKDDDWRESVSNNSTTNVVERLKSLLGRLPQIIRDFERNNGAEAIIPPIVRGGKSLSLSDETKISDDDSASEVENADEDEDLVIVNDGFVATYEVSQNELQARFSEMNLNVNPLALLLKDDDISSFYSSIDQKNEIGECSEYVSDNDKAESDVAFVININYAGNDIHESLIRQKIRAHGELLPFLFQRSIEGRKVAHNDDFLRKFMQTHTEAHERAMLGFLVHCGYLVWKPK